MFEKAVQVSTETGKTTKFIDLYKHGAFVLEAKQGSESNTGKLGTAKRDTPTWNVAMNAAFGQAIDYASALDQPPPFIIVTDIGYCFDIYASFDGSPRYRPFPNALGHRFFLTRLAERADTLRSIFLDPLSLDPSKIAVEITREVAAHLADLTRRLEKAGHAPQAVADFLMRVIFTCFAEDVGLLPEEMFTAELRDHWIKSPRSFPQGVENLWRAMNDGSVFGFFGKLLHFNGGLFKSPTALPLEKGDLEVLLEAASCRWNKVDPAIFGTLIEGALDKKERHSLGAHFTPRAYVERLVRPTIEEPIREDWDATQGKIRGLASNNKIKEAKVEARAFMKRLSEVRVLDPACGSANFLYVALDLLKAIEDEAFALLLALEGGQTELCLDACEVTPRQFLGIEVNPRAKAIAELVLWIGYLQWHFRTKHRGGKPREPVLEDYRNIECRDAVLSYDSIELARDERTGKPLSRWDGETMKKHPATGELVPDNRFTKPVHTYVNPRRSQWPTARFVIGNPPFIGAKNIRGDLGDSYAEALREVYPKVPDSADLVMYWWERAAAAVARGEVERAGIITTNSIRQVFNRRIVESALADSSACLLFAIPDHPWVDVTDGAAVRIAMTVVGRQSKPAQQGKLATVTSESVGADGVSTVMLSERLGELRSDLSVGADVSGAKTLRANTGLSFQGMKPHGEGFLVSKSQAEALGFGVDPAVKSHVREYMNGRDFSARSRGTYIVDLFGLNEQDARDRVPTLYQWLFDRVKQEREAKSGATSDSKEYAKKWWLFAKTRPAMRAALFGLPRYIVTSETAKHRIFAFAPSNIVPDQKLRVVADASAFVLGVLSSRIHVTWALAAGGTLEDRPVYNNTRCFEPFPFPEATDAQRVKIQALADSLDSHRKAQQAKYYDVTITGMYNVLGKLRSGSELDPKEKVVHQHALVAVLKSLHDDLDTAVFDAYGWSRDLSDEEILERLVLLNADRAREEDYETIRWLRPEFQRGAGADIETAEIKPTGDEHPGIAKSKPPAGPGIAATRAGTGKRKSKRAAR